MSRFCVRCGVEEPELIIDGLCVRCLVSEGKVVRPPKNIDVIICPSCNSIKLEGKWLVGIKLDDFLRDMILKGSDFHKDFKLTSLDISVEGSRVTARFEGFLKTAEVVKEYLINLNISKSLCPHCSKIKGGHYDAVIQVRTSLKKFSDVLRNKLVDALLKSSISNHISEIEFVREGLDVKVLSQGFARKLTNDLISMYGGTSKESWKVVGVSSSGKKVSKLTISIRLLGLMPGDIIMFNGRPALVENISGNSVVVKPLDSGNMVKLYASDLSTKDILVIGRDEYELVDGYVAEVSDNKALVKEVLSGSMFELAAPENIVSGSKVKLLIYKDRVYLANVER